MINPVIRKVKLKDHKAIADIYNQYIDLGQSTMVEQRYTAESISTWVRSLRERECMYTLTIGEKVIGWGIIKKYSDRAGYRFAGETSVFITRSKLRHGYGSLMKKHLILEAKRLEYRHLVARIFATNKSSIQYNLQLGYTEVGIQKEIGYKNGKWQDIMVMQYLIADNSE